jgi:hypothetical protein
MKPETFARLISEARAALAECERTVRELAANDEGWQRHQYEIGRDLAQHWLNKASWADIESLIPAATSDQAPGDNPVWKAVEATYPDLRQYDRSRGFLDKVREEHDRIADAARAAPTP